MDCLPALALSRRGKVWDLSFETARRVIDLSRVRFVFVIVEAPASVGRLSLRREPAVPEEFQPSSLAPDQILS